ncbi:Predicted ATP-dependent endonuclease of the OLD family, contains P-loop ATPase and TOPRIM domains [Maribacter dokdonensis]|uniref:Predicted ATP-dependent endonuclease of the OLD family, contains P-loop ATPase and TOPRIM domains n=1 Tax=Maribacter dokdonensis TaxID=320912 RepID=A0A1H4M901_9FLAO|nr:ATP-dependent endonuclease [Maribacter dokdonensis]SEB79218.1 Predicted ATP-dependent endonuclease of the OLD family, contains P-loop ATPase and TOPRIM domains [Maribacter dokdonensis]
MHLNVIRIQNFRRLRDVTIDLNEDISIFVGANNSGKTSVSQALQLFLSSSREKFTIHDFSASSWPEIESFANAENGSELPEITIDLWFSVEASDLHRVIDLLPSLSWQGNYVGIRIALSPIDADATKSRFESAKTSALAALGEVDGEQGFAPFPKSLTDFLTTELKREYELRYYVLDNAKFDDNFKELADYTPLQIIPDKGSTGKSRSGKDIINSLIRVDFLQAQRHLSDTSGGSRNEELSRHLSRFYKRNLEKRSDDYEAMRALSESENLMNKHLEDVFSDTLDRLSNLGYPGLTNPGLKIMSDLNPSVLMSGQDGAQVHYVLDGGLTLPDKYNGLGFKNLIYMVVELLDLHNQWVDISENRPPLHLVFIEEPEAHLHTQLQQVFVNKVLDILIDEDAENYSSQLILTTHSAHILYERGFKPIRYFRREHTGSQQSTTVLNLSKFYTITEEPIRDFLERYLKLTHCDLFFADAAILVEGNVERLLTPLMIEKVAPELKTAYLTILEIGGAYGHRFQSLIEFLGITTLIITDLDSVQGLAPEAEPSVGIPVEENDLEVDEYEDIDEEEDGVPKKGSTCRVETLHAVTSNQTLIQWLPQQKTISDLLAASSESKIQSRSVQTPATVKVCYQNTVTITRGEDSLELAGRTLEEAFAFENLVWSQDISNKDLKLRVKSSDDPTLDLTAERLHKRIHSKNFKKTDFALALLTKNIDDWVVPSYIKEGLEWLNAELTVSPVISVAQENLTINQDEEE